MKFKYLFVAIMSLLILTGCSAEAETKSDGSQLIPEGVDNGTVSQEYYDEIVRFFEGSQDYEGEQNSYIAQVDPDNGNDKNIAFRKELMSHVESYTAFLDTFQFESDNDAEMKLSSSLENYIEFKKEEADFINVTASIGGTYAETYGLLLMKQEEATKMEAALYELLDEYKLGYNN